MNEKNCFLHFFEDLGWILRDGRKDVTLFKFSVSLSVTLTESIVANT